MTSEELLDKNFTYHPPTENQRMIYDHMRADFRVLATVIMGFCPDSRERSLAMTKLEEALMWANASVARNT